MYGYYGWGGAIVVFQVICIIHAVRTKNSDWIWIVLFFPLVGCLIYIATQVRGVGRSGQKLASSLVNVVAPSRRVEALRAQLDHAPTVNNRLALAEELVRNKQYDEALELYEISGAHKDDPEVLKQRSIAFFEMGNLAAAKATLEHLFDAQPREKSPAMRLLYARTVEALDDLDGALDAYDAARPGALGDETRCRHAGTLEKAGRADEALAIYNRIVKEASQSDRRYRQENREWIQIAKAKVSGAKAS
ncbi:MAG TPA: tetratricopeptide repeat protein [Kofleriaceae bacterium]|jgi:hypothetical protein